MTDFRPMSQATLFVRPSRTERTFPKEHRFLIVTRTSDPPSPGKRLASSRLERPARAALLLMAKPLIGDKGIGVASEMLRPSRLAAVPCGHLDRHRKPPRLAPRNHMAARLPKSHE